ncbi:MAG: hypothetical protein U1D67_08005 [Dehalococcoidia bacterium]|nr:hypothetical protein [Dehalococcoidia bacterium]MDZ4247048.1 hypothetical protein [Dehalococcoidia bacterium]
MSAKEKTTQYNIDLDWFDRKRMSFVTVATERMCSACLEKHPPDDKGNPQKIIKMISDHCQKDENYIHDEQPVAESIFRVFLSNNNKPLTIADIVEKLNQHRGASTVSPTPETVERLLETPLFFGMGPVNN